MCKREETCCFTGHRMLPSATLPQLRVQLEQTLRDLIVEGFRCFCAGGALGFDTLAAETVLQLREAYPQICLQLVLPCRDQSKNWKAEDVERYESVKAQADQVVYTAESYAPGCMHRRNRYLVDHSAICVAYCTRSTGGSAYTVNYARRRNLRILLLQADTRRQVC